MIISPLKIRIKIFGIRVKITIGMDHLVDLLSQLANQLPEKYRLMVLAVIEFMLLEE